MEYKPVTAVWEITMGCNMRCKHCGSICENPQPDELTTEEALKLCEDLGKLGFRNITLSGGEPTTRKDWYIIAKGLRKNGIIPTMITNGWLMNEDIIDKAIEAQLGTVAISIDGLQETHDFIRRPGSFERDMKALELMNRKGLHSSVITTINKKNIDQLEEMKRVFIEKGVKSWQLQIGLPMGNLKKNSDMVLEPEAIDRIIDFAYENLSDNKIVICLADNIGYYNVKSMKVNRNFSKQETMWTGCAAGKYSIGILCNGDIVGCTSMRTKEYIEGNIRKTSIIDIWTNPDSFKWNRKIKKEDLEGFCSKCAYGDTCLGGCSNSRLCMENSIYKHNRYCSYHTFIRNKKEQINKIEDVNTLYNSALGLSEKRQFQVAGLLLERALQLDTKNLNVLNLYGYVNFMLKNYDDAKRANEEVLKLNNDNVYANKGLGLTLCKLGSIEDGLSHLRRAAELTDSSYMEPYHDFIIALIENNKINEAKEVLLKAKKVSEKFFNENKSLYDELKVS